MPIYKSGLQLHAGLFDLYLKGKNLETPEAFCEAFVGALVEVERSSSQFVHRDVCGKLQLLTLGVRPFFTLTKKRADGDQQLRCWVRDCHFREDGTHADFAGQGCIFDGYGTFEELQRLTQNILTKRKFSDYRRFEDDYYVVWL